MKTFKSFKQFINYCEANGVEKNKINGNSLGGQAGGCYAFFSSKNGDIIKHQLSLRGIKHFTTDKADEFLSKVYFPKIGKKVERQILGTLKQIEFSEDIEL